MNSRIVFNWGSFVLIMLLVLGLGFVPCPSIDNAIANSLLPLLDHGGSWGGYVIREVLDLRSGNGTAHPFRGIISLIGIVYCIYRFSMWKGDGAVFWLWPGRLDDEDFD